jgi:3-dehydroquinate synthetase
VRSTTFETRRETSTEYVFGSVDDAMGRWSDASGGSPLVAVVDAEVLRNHPLLVERLLEGPAWLGRVVLDGGERCKSVGQLTALLEQLEELRIPKHGTVVAIGGGAVCDVAGLAALLINRSVGLVLVPTTLLSQVDAAVGGKNGINTAHRKNLIGHFHHPDLVACDARFLTTLPRRQVVSGAAECVKVLAVASEVAFEAHRTVLAGCEVSGDDLDPWQAVTWDAARYKLELLADDPFERSSRRLLNYGHAFAHSLEEMTRHRVLHGEAVLLGMLIENEVSRELGLAGPALDGLHDLTASLLTPACSEAMVPFAEVRPEVDNLRALRRGAMNLVCLTGPGEATIVDDADDDVLAAAWTRVASLVGVRLAPTLLVHG